MMPESPRTEGMVDASADYYQESKVFRAIQNAYALEYDRVEASNHDIELQLSPYTATWGLVYWEQSVGLEPYPSNDYELKRLRILPRLINEENFSAKLIHNLAASFGTTVEVIVDTVGCLVTIIFAQNVPKYIQEFNNILENVVHAHLGIQYVFEYNQHIKFQQFTHEELGTYTHDQLRNEVF
jgi:hypothetical protein